MLFRDIKRLATNVNAGYPNITFGSGDPDINLIAAAAGIEDVPLQPRNGTNSLRGKVMLPEPNKCRRIRRRPHRIYVRILLRAGAVFRWSSWNPR